MEDELIDNDLEKSPDNTVMELIKWWEYIRIHYNILIVLIIVFIFIYESSIMPFRARVGSYQIIVTLIYLFVLNLFYCLGWGLPLLLSHYFKVNHSSIPMRFALLTLGVVLSVLFTLGVFPYALY